MIVTEIRTHEKKKEKDFCIFEVELDGEPLCQEEGKTLLLSKSELAEFNLQKGSKVSFPDRKELLESIFLRRGKSIALRAISKRNMTEKETFDKLKTWEIPDRIAAEILGWLKETGILGDGTYAENYISYRGRNKSRRDLLYTLKAKGIADTEVVSAMENNCFDEYDAALTIAEKRLRSIHGDEQSLKDFEKKEIDKIIGYLFRKGFSLDNCKKALNEAFLRIMDEQD